MFYEPRIFIPNRNEFVLQEKARLKNPDEFYFSMQKQKMENGKLTNLEGPKDSNGKVITDDMVMLMKNQDRVYLRTMRQIQQKRLNRKEIKGCRRHVVYDEENEEVVEEKVGNNETDIGKDEENLRKLCVMEKKLDIERNLRSKGRKTQGW